MRSFSRKALGVAAAAVAGTVGLGAGLAGAADSGSSGGSSDVQLVQTDPSTTVPDDAPDGGGTARDRNCDHEKDGSEGEGSSSDASQTSYEASYRRGDRTSLRWG